MAFLAVEDQALFISFDDLLANDTDVDGDPLSVTAVETDFGGTAVLTDGGVVFTPHADYVGDATLVYAVSDPAGATASAAVSLSVASVNDAPVVVVDLPTVEIDEGAELFLAYDDLAATGFDVDGDALEVARASTVSNGTVVFGQEGLTFTADAPGVGTFDYTLTDGEGGEVTATINVDVIAEATPDPDPQPEDRITETVSFTVLADRGAVAFQDGIVDPDSETLDPTNQNGHKRLVGIVGDGDGELEAGELGHVMSRTGYGQRMVSLNDDNGAEDPVEISAHGQRNNRVASDLTHAVRFSDQGGFGLDNGPDGEPTAKSLNNGDSITFSVAEEKAIDELTFTVETGDRTGAVTVVLDVDGEILGGSRGSWSTDGLVELEGLTDDDVVEIDLVGEMISVNGDVLDRDFSALFDAAEADGFDNLTIGAPRGGGERFGMRDVGVDVSSPAASPVASQLLLPATDDLAIASEKTGGVYVCTFPEADDAMTSGAQADAICEGKADDRYVCVEPVELDAATKANEASLNQVGTEGSFEDFLFEEFMRGSHLGTMLDAGDYHLA